ncbi:MAG: hypothetical protein AAF086_03400 [Planctomycetota bacterium]
MSEFNPEQLDESTPTDPRLDALLDDALAAGEVPAGLNDRIVAATADRLSPAQAADDAPAVIGRLGGGFAWRSLAAGLLFALVLGGVWVFNQQPASTEIGPLAHNGNGHHRGDDEAVATAADAPKLDTALAQLAEAELEADWIDDRIAMLSMQVTWAQDAGDAGLWDGGALDSLDTAIARDTFDDVADEMEWYF